MCIFDAKEALSLKKLWFVILHQQKFMIFRLISFSFKNPSYQKFEKRIKKTLLINDKKYFKMLGNIETT